VQGDLAGKTGTTQNNTDGWFLLMQPNLVAGAWVGFNDPRVTIRSSHWGQGGHNALRIVGDFFRQGQKARLIDTGARFPEVVRDPAEFDRIETIPLSPIESVSHTPSNAAVPRMQDLATGR
jgi:penicillin-binding protein 1A